MTDVRHEELRFHCLQLKKLERMKVGLELQVSAMERDGLMAPLVIPATDAAIDQLAKPTKKLKTQLMSFVSGSRVEAWIEGTAGLGPAVVLGIGLMPPLSPDWISDPTEDPPNFMLGVRACYKYAGLHVGDDGRAPRRRQGEFLGFDTFLKSVWIYRVAVTIEKNAGGVTSTGAVRARSPYRDLYDWRKAHTLATHPPMLEVGECESCDAARRTSQRKREASNQTRERQSIGGDCSAEGGVHWSDGHRRADALRYTAKQVLKDAWLVANGKAPSVEDRFDSELAEMVGAERDAEAA